eukprot:6820984-Pyramimonas_sp.AAC.1
MAHPWSAEGCGWYTSRRQDGACPRHSASRGGGTSAHVGKSCPNKGRPTTPTVSARENRGPAEWFLPFGGER